MWRIIRPIFAVFKEYIFLKSGLRNLASRNSKQSPVIWCKVYFDISNRLDVTHECDRQTDRQMDDIPLRGRKPMVLPLLKVISSKFSTKLLYRLRDRQSECVAVGLMQQLQYNSSRVHLVALSRS